MRSSNPALNSKTFEHNGPVTEKMTLNGTTTKTLILLMLVMFAASKTWAMFLDGNPNLTLFMIGGLIGGLIFAIITIFKKTWSPVTAPIYALLEGLALGGISAFFEQMYPGIVIDAVFLTFGTLFALLMAYKSGMIKATENFKLGIVAATGGIMLIYVINFIMSFFGSQIPLIHESGTFGILFSLFVVTIAALNLVLDFDFIENGVKAGAPKYMEWYASFGLIVTLVWLYLEILRLLAKLRNRN
ncbi:MAG: Bax inhibitor-1/YccA family protein [DPANN group archaeon]|nr:Bax inhibitor-1/YccA family protein [DPANN group archaeon]